MATESVAHDTVYVETADLYDDETKVTTRGVDGQKLVKYENTFYNGNLQSSRSVDSITTSEPVTEVIAVGTTPRPSTASYGEYFWPADGPVTSYFGYRCVSVGSRYHKGIDIGGSTGDPIYAADGGEVICAEWGSGYGYVVKVLHDNGDVTVYGHCSEFAVEVGDRVFRGQTIAYMGMTGTASATHLHLRFRSTGRRLIR